MEEDTEYKKLPIDERCVHKVWKARVDGYEEAAKLFRTIDDEKSPEWNKYLGLIKKFVTDSNAVAQEKGLEAALVFVENSGNAGKTVGEVMGGIITKCIGAPKAKTKDLAVQITLMYVEIERHEVVLEELLKGTDQKNPKIVAACVAAVTQALREFGSKVMSIKPIVKKLPALLSDRDKAVRDEAKTLTIEIYRWIGAAFKSQIASLPAVLLTELEAEFEKVSGEKAVPTRYLRSQQEKQMLAAVAISSGEVDDGADADEVDEAEEIDPMDLIDPVDILSKLPKDFYEKLEAKKWQERKESLEALEALLQNPKLQPGDYGDVVRALKKVITKDSNVVLVALGGKCLAMLAKGLGKKFNTYAGACVPAVLEKFKEKKTNVVTALRDAIDAMYPATTLESIQEDILEALANKNPNVKMETASFLARAFSKTVPTILNKKLLKAFVTALIKTLNESDPAVRDASAEALGTLMKLVGEKAIGPYIAEVDALKQAKIKECCDKAVITVKIPGPKKERPATAPPKTNAGPATGAVKKGGSTEPKPVARPATAGVKKPAATKKAAAGGGGSGVAKSASASKVLPTERDMSQEEIDDRAAEILPADVTQGLGDSNWKTRLAAVESLTGVIADLDPKGGHSQVVLRTLAKKPGLKDTNFQVLKGKLENVRAAVERLGITATTADYIMNDITEKLGDAKNSGPAGLALTAIAEAIKLEYAVAKVMEFAFEQKSPKVQQEALTWVNNAIKEFGFQVNPKLLLEDSKKAVQSINPAVRAAGITLLGTMYLFMGNTLAMFFENEKPALKQQIQTEFDKCAGQRPPAPTRGLSKCASKASVDDLDDDGEVEEQPAINMNDLFPRVDISSQITEALLAEISDKNWKTRNEGLEKLRAIIAEAKLIKSNLGDLPQVLAQRLVDSNAKIAQTSVELCQQIAVAMGPPSKQYVRVWFPGIVKGLGDSKAFIRSACITCINIMGDQAGYKEFFESEMIADALKTGSPALKTEVWGWLAEKLPGLPTKSIQKDELHSLLPHLYANICDRNADVRKNANEAVLGIMIHLGYEGMVKALDKQKPTSKKDIQAALDKARPNLPVKPLPKNKQQAPIVEEPTKVVRPGTAKVQKAAAGGAAKANPAPTSRKKEEEVDTSPLLAINNMKSQRLLDEQKLKVLKWTFTTPREEFTDLLKEQMTSANVNKGLIANMFHEDFRYHLKVIDALIEDLPKNDKGLICNLDLIMKWLSLRFYDTNPSVLLKGLDYLNLVFQMLIESQYVLAENEGSSFVPHLLTKIGDPKDVVRNGVRSLLRQICLVYPFAKVFVFIMDALKSKNARQRAECLDELGYLIETYGLTVCQPTQQAALKEIAKHISDRDNSVRNAALNTVVQAYFLAGEKVYKLIGQLSEKDLSMLDERIKRSKKTAAVKKPATIEIVKVPSSVEVHAPDSDPVVVEEEDIVVPPMEQPEEAIPVVRKRRSVVFNDTIRFNDSTSGRFNDEVDETGQNAHKRLREEPILNSPVPTKKPPEVVNPPSRPSGPFKLDENVIAEIECNWVKAEQHRKLDLPKIDVSFIYDSITVIPVRGVAYPEDKFQQLLARTLHRPISAHSRDYAMSPPSHLRSPAYGGGGSNKPKPTANLADALPKLDPNLLRIIRGIGSADVYTAHAAINELSDILESQEKQAVLRDYEEIYIQSILQQFKYLQQKPLAESLAMYQPLLHSIYSFFASKTLGKNLSVNTIKSLIAVLLGLMADNKLGGSTDDAQFTKVVNGICLKILDRTNFTNLNCALIRLLKESCQTSCLPKFTDLLMKCIWRNVKVIPDRLPDLDYDAVLLEVHEFMLALPSIWWQQRPSDTPLRTVKTIIHNMTKIKGNTILQHLNKIPSHSELNTYILRILKNLNKESSSAATVATANNQHAAAVANSNSENNNTQHRHGSRPVHETHEEVSNIFKLISNTDTSQEGLAKLHEFKSRNADVDILPFLKGASVSFQKYIIDGLAELDAKNQGLGDGNNKAMAGNRVAASTINPDYWMERLNSLMTKTNPGQPNSATVNGQYSDNKITDENLNVNQLQQPKVNLLRKEVGGGLGSGLTVPMGGGGVGGVGGGNSGSISLHRRELLAQKLEQIKQQK
ncbi:protein mini spindles-like isoform X1 [Culex pipiens pallens]|uniref:protein mini spindles-like isoform X1 n=1 Tax=Culex pipiens pallens TaxID=42434 RepID=UPI0019544376|nr:protein mini spindles-like isoform X1 [Culex pipiens pallens]